MASRALSLLAAFANPIFLAAAIGGWRDQPNAAIEQRERARRASQYVRS